MLTSIALIFLCGLFLSAIFKKIHFPGLVGMILTGILLGPFAFNLLDTSILNIAAELRRIALVIILTRAGLALDITDLKKVGRPAILMCFVPACFEILGCILIAPHIMNVSMVEAAIIGSTIAAVSPAVIVPRMINLIEKGYGKSHSIPQLVLAGASVDDVFVIVVFTAFTALGKGESVSAFKFLEIPVSIVLGIILGIVVGMILITIFKKIHMRDSVKLLILISVSFLFLTIEDTIGNVIPVSGLIAIMSMGIVIKQKYNILAVRLSGKYNKLWVAAEVVLFVLVGAAIDLKYAVSAGVKALIIVLGSLVFRMASVFVCMVKTKLSVKEKIFCMIAYTPKATVQAAIGAVPLSMGLACGNLVLTVAVLSILITAPLGAFMIDLLYQRLLDIDEKC